MKKNKSKMLEALELVSPIIPALIYWHDRKGVVLGANERCLKELGVTAEFLIGKSPYDFYDKELAEYILKHNEKVMSSKQILSQEESAKNFETGKLKHYISIKSPLYDDNGNVIGIIGTSIDITAEKEAARLQAENEAQRKVIALQGKFKKIIDEFDHILQVNKFNSLNDELGIESDSTNIDPVIIKLTRREREILYFLSLHKSPKDIAIILTGLENKSIAPATVQAIINKQLYIKFGVYSVGKLIEKATALDMLPSFLEP